tara:strand:- start:1160 stop:1558 length:399 start_codon:yes stop_codon:yes gene_type:complete
MVKEASADPPLYLYMKSGRTGREFLKNRNKQRRKKRMLTPSGLKDVAKNKGKTLTTEGTGETISALNKQTGGTHYKDMVIQPAEYAEQNGLSLLEGNVVKYISRWKKKGKPLEDLTKAKHCIDLLIEIHKVK